MRRSASLLIIAGPLIGAIVAAVAAEIYLQNGFMISAEPIMPKLRENLAAGGHQAHVLGALGGRVPQKPAQDHRYYRHHRLYRRLAL